MTTDYHKITLPQSQYISGMAAFGIILLGMFFLLYTDITTLSTTLLLSGNLMMFVFPVVVLVAMFLWSALRLPTVIILNAFDCTITLKYLIPALAPASRNSHFSDWEAVLSCLYTSDDSADIILLLRSADGKYLQLDRRGAAYYPKKGFWDVSFEYFEPEELRDLRIRIANFTGLKDGGFLQKQIHDLSLKEFP